MKREKNVEKRALKEKVTTAFRERFGRGPSVVIRAPGRVNLLGAHVDYNEGWVMPAAIDRAVWLAAGHAEGDRVTVCALDMEEEAGFSLSTLSRPDGANEIRWIGYPRGVAWVLQRSGYSVAAMEAVLASDVPIGAGVSSSAAVEVAFISAWEALGQLQLSGLKKAQLGQRAENEYVGVASGIMDQFASLHGASDHLILLDCRTLEHELIALPPGTAFLVADSGVRRELAGSNYNERRRQCEEAVTVLQDYLPNIRALRDVTPEDFELYAHRLPIDVRRRARHVVEECTRVLDGARLLGEEDVAAFGALIRRSHTSSRDLYEVSIPELDLLAASAWQTQGCYGARLTGAGFGGCVVALVDAQAAATVAQAMQEAFRAEFSRTPAIFTTRAADGLRLT